MQAHKLKQVVADADNAINREDFDSLMDFYSDNATLVVHPGLIVSGREKIRAAFSAIAEHFNHTLVVKQGEMFVIECGDTALVLAQTLLSGEQKSGSSFSMERSATYIFKKDSGDVWRCVIDNSYGTELLKSEPTTQLHLVCGKIGSGKSTLSKQLSSRPKTILISEDDWLSQLYPGEINNIADYVRCTGLLRNVISDHIRVLLRSGLSVVLDFPANTLSSRKWAMNIIEQAGIAHELHYLDVSDDICKARLRGRNADNTHPFTTSDAEFEEITRYFVPPTENEGFNIIRHH